MYIIHYEKQNKLNPTPRNNKHQQRAGHIVYYYYWKLGEHI
jgi:hypothetical protein